MRVFPSAQSPDAADPDPEPGHCPRRHIGPAILLAAGAASLASVIVVGVLVVFQDAFRIGATASGLNPGGGGPGFMLMAPPALAALMVARWCEARRVLRELIIVLAVAVPGVLVLPSLLLVLAGAVLPPEFPSLASIVSASAMAWVVPIAVMAILARA